ncbi:MAG: SoxR reducing system RseC family protein [Deltaproteobacteria bacterium]|nr:SoxR reducing system RseC family protein [Deltaproteobacteria bacterium]
MIEERATVASIRENGLAVLRAKRTKSCDGCTSKDTCLSVSDEEMEIEAINEAGAKAGDRVVFTMPEGAVIRAGVLVYLVPLIGFIIGVVVAQIATPSLFPDMNADAASAVLGFIVMIAAYFAVSAYSKKAGATNDTARIIRIE